MYWPAVQLLTGLHVRSETSVAATDAHCIAVQPVAAVHAVALPVGEYDVSGGQTAYRSVAYLGCTTRTAGWSWRCCWQ